MLRHQFEEQRLTLSTLEQHLAALQEIENEIAPEQETEFKLALQEALTKTAEKRDRVAHVIWDLMRQATIAQAEMCSHEDEIMRLKERGLRFEARASGLKDYVLGVMRALPKPAKGPRKLEGLTSTLKANGVAPSVGVLDESQVPLEYKRVTVKMPAYLWQRIARDASEVECRELKAAYEVDRTALLEALKKPCIAKGCGGSGEILPSGPSDSPVKICEACHGTGKQEIPGARLETDKLRLVIE